MKKSNIKVNGKFFENTRINDTHMRTTVYPDTLWDKLKLIWILIRYPKIAQVRMSISIKELQIDQDEIIWDN